MSVYKYKWLVKLVFIIHKNLISYSKIHHYNLQQQVLYCQSLGLKINSHFIKYENVTTIGSDATSVVLCLKNDGQEDEDDGEEGKQVV